jgi:rRNA maturation protein Nop10
MPRQPCPRCGENRWNEQNNGQRECLDCGQVVVIVAPAKLAKKEPKR